jgi:hypothetical protein
MLFIKPGVRITGMRPEILLATVAAERVYEEAGHDFTVTACIDGEHMAGSLHYAGAAIDVGTRDLAPADVQKVIARIKECLGADFDVLLEVDHMHIEFQPKQALTNV